MSSFKDNFQREENQETQYDDSAFFTFGGTILLVLIFTLLVLIYKRIFYDKKYISDPTYVNCNCSNCKERMKNHYDRIKKKKRNFWFYFMIVSVFALSYFFYLSYNQIVQHTNHFKTFDPYEILEIPVGAETKEIKRAYKLKALKYHPDKNPNNLQAKAQFILIAKAYEALTDEIAKRNYELYGNPDGPGSMRLAVGLPSFILKKENHMPILILFIIFILVIVPALFLWWYSNSNKYDESGMLAGNQRIFYEYLNENILPRQMPFVLGLAIEYTSLVIRAEEAGELEKLYKRFLDQMPKHKVEVIPPANKKAICLFYAYINNVHVGYPNYEKDLELILLPTPVLLNNMYNMAIYCTQYHMYNKQVKNFGLICIKTIIEFSQMLHQKLPIGSSPFLQLPHFTEEKIKSLSKLIRNKKVFTNQNSFTEFLNANSKKLEASEEEKKDMFDRREILSGEFNENEIEDIESAVSLLPIYKPSVEVYVDGFDDILVDDFVTIKVTVDRVNLPKGKQIGVAHSAKFPEIFKEKVVVIITQENRIIFESILTIDDKITEHKFNSPIRDVSKIFILAWNV